MFDLMGFSRRTVELNPTHSAIVCDLHTHPLSAGESIGRVSAEESRNVREGKHSISFAPSGDAMHGDIGFANTVNFESAFQEFRKKGVTVEARQAVVDAAEITYYRLIEEQDLQPRFKGLWQRMENFSVTTVVSKAYET
jgi:hypothetical protein